jgi:type IV fimbrial biogenesis protein FimU
MRQVRRTGVTLLEILIVISILCVLLAISIPSMKVVHQRNQLHISAREVVALLKYARGEAVLGEKEVEVRFDVPGDRYRLDLRESGEGEYVRERDRVLKSSERIRHLPRTVHFLEITSEAEADEKAGIARIIFYPNGSATAATIILGNDRKRNMTIEVAGATGLTRAYNGLPQVEEETQKANSQKANDTQTSAWYEVY